MRTVLFCLTAVFFLPMIPLSTWGAVGMGADGDYTSAGVCARCHQGLYKSWETTFHAQAAVNQVFIGEMEKAEEENGPETRIFCLTCHSPTTRVTMDYNLTRPLSREGVTCDFCHTVVSVDLDRKDMRFDIDLSPIKMGPGSRNTRPAHRTGKNPLLLQSEFCAGCHQLLNGHGVAVLDTYREWRSSIYKGKMVNCQICHMPEVLGTTILLKGKIVERPSHLHFQMGGHSQTQLAIAASLGTKVSFDGEELEVKTVVENVKAGHMMPTGLPNKLIVLEVSLLDREGTLLEMQKRSYRRVLEDEKGQPLEEMNQFVLRAVRVAEDTRIAPKERRKERFTFQVPQGTESAIVQARLIYRLKIPNLIPPYLNYEMASSKKIVSTGDGRPGIIKGLTMALGLIFLLVMVLVIYRFRVDRAKDH